VESNHAGPRRRKSNWLCMRQEIVKLVGTVSKNMNTWRASCRNC
jgi:hypothetical protein